MGTVKAIAHIYTDNEYLYSYIDKNDKDKINTLLKKKPDLLQKPLTYTTKVTALHHSAYIEQYNANVNFVTDKGQTALIAAVKRNHLKIAQYLIDKGANTDYFSGDGLYTIQYAIILGLYQMALLIYEHMKNKSILRKPIEYQILSKQYKCRYVNYEIFLRELQNMMDPSSTQDFLTRPKKKFKDPVIDPRETWKQWFARTAAFKDPPMVQRSSLPEDLQPQNARFGKVSHFLTRMTLSPMAPLPHFNKPAEVQTEMEFQDSKQQMKLKPLQAQTVS